SWAQVVSHAEAAQHDGRFFVPPERLYLDPTAWRTQLAGRPRVEVEGLEELAGDGARALTYATDGLGLRGGAVPAEGPLAQVATQLGTWSREGARVVLVASSTRQRERLQGL